jgi:mannose-6-phosphate isomerase-like protein (cupin superfamily)
MNPDHPELPGHGVPVFDHIDESREYFFREGCHILEWHNTPQYPLVSVARARVEPGVQTRRHRLIGVTERYLIQQGEGVVSIGAAAPVEVKAGSSVVIPKGVDQSIRHSGTTDLVFWAVCTPRFVPECYVDTAQA